MNKDMNILDAKRIILFNIFCLKVAEMSKGKKITTFLWIGFPCSKQFNSLTNESKLQFTYRKRKENDRKDSIECKISVKEFHIFLKQYNLFVIKKAKREVKLICKSDFIGNGSQC